jgi:hypothetical protein
MGGRLVEGPTMAGWTSDWKEELGRWLQPFLDRLGHKARRPWPDSSEQLFCDYVILSSCRSAQQHENSGACVPRQRT